MKRGWNGTSGRQLSGSREYASAHGGKDAFLVFEPDDLFTLLACCYRSVYHTGVV